jgi:hypothetical protein
MCIRSLLCRGTVEKDVQITLRDSRWPTQLVHTIKVQSLAWPMIHFLSKLWVNLTVSFDERVPDICQKVSAQFRIILTAPIREIRKEF